MRLSRKLRVHVDFSITISSRLGLILAVLIGLTASSASAAVWYVNDTSTTGDSFTSAIGFDTNNGLTSATPKRNITAVTPLLSAGDTIYIDAGTFDSIVTVSATETAAIRIDTNTIWVIGVDSTKTIIDPIGANSTKNLYGVYADTQTGLTIRNIAVTGAYEGIYFLNVDLSAITGDSLGVNGDSGIYLAYGSDTNTVSNNTANSNASGGIYLNSSSNNNTVSGNIVNSNVYGIVLRTSLNNMVSGNNANSNTTGNIQLNSSANNNTVSGNTADSSINGILLKLTADANTISGNTANSNSSTGIGLDASSNNLVSDNTANLNAFSGIYIPGISNNNTVSGNTMNSNPQYQFTIAGAATTDTFQKNNMKASVTLPESYVNNISTIATSRFIMTRNFWQTRDSGVIRNRIWPANARDSVVYTPFRLGIVDTAPLADTVAPKAPDTVTATTIDSTRIRINWGAVSTSEEAETVVGLNGYRVYRSNQVDSTFWELRGQVGNATTTYTDSGLSVGQSFFYRVTSLDNHAPFENEAFYSDSIAFDTTSTPVSIIGIASAPSASPISRTGPDSAVIAFTVRGANPDTVNGIIVRLAGNIPSADVDTLSLYRDGNKNGRYEAGQDTLISILNFSSGDTFNATGLTAGINGADSFIVTISLEDTANFGDTFTASIPVNGLATSNTGVGPGAPFSSAGIWTVNTGVDSTGPNVWYVNDTSTTGDSFTAALGNSSNNGLTILTPKRFLNDIENLLTPGDTVYIDAGTFNEIDTVSIAVNSIWLIGKDSLSTIVDFGDTASASARAVAASGVNRITLRDFKIMSGRYGVFWNNVDSSSIERVSVSNAGLHGIRLENGSAQNTLRNNFATGSPLNGYGFSLNASTDNTLTSNVSMKNGHGFFTEVSSSNNIFSQNISSWNMAHGFSLDNSNGNAYRDNIVSNNLGNGFSVAASSTSNVFSQNYIDSNLVGAVYIGNTANSDTFTKNVFILSPSNPDSGVQNVTTNSHAFIRNWWGTTDTIAIKTKMWGSGRDLVIYTPFRLGSVDTTLLADTVASKAPDTVTATTIDSTRIRIDWAAVSTSEEAETVVGLNLYRVYRATTADSSFWELRGTVNNSTTTYTDSGLSVGRGFYYRVTSADNHTPFENQSFYSDSIASAFTTSNGNLLIGNGYDSTSGAIFFETRTTAIVAFYAPGETVRVQVGATDVSTLATSNGSGSDTVQIGFGLVSGNNTVTITRTNPLGVSQPYTRTVVSDTTAPNVYFVTIDTGALLAANDTIAVTFSATGTPASYRLQGDITESSATFIGYSGTETFSAVAHMTSGDTIKTVSVSVKDSAGNISTALSDTVTRNSTLGTTITPTFTPATGDTTAVVQPAANDQVNETVTILQGMSDTIVVVLGDAKNDTVTVKLDFADSLKLNLIVCARIDTAAFATTGESTGRISNYALGSNTIREILVRDSQNRNIGPDTKTFNSCRIIWNLGASLGAVKSSLEVFYFDTVTRKWLLARTDSRVVDSAGKDSFVNYATGDTLSILVRHFTIFGVFPALGGFPAQGNVSNVTVYPNPYVPYDGNLSNGEKGTATEGIRIANLSGNDKIEIYDIRGRLVNEITTVTGTGLAIWDARNQDKQEVATGVYFIVVKGIGGIVVRKVAVVR